MMRPTVTRLAVLLSLALGLAACIDARVDVAVTSPTTAHTELTQTMGADFYAMIKLDREQALKAAEAAGRPLQPAVFCAEGTLVENLDGSATCTIVSDGAFAGPTAGEVDSRVRFAAAGPGLVRVSLPTAPLRAEIGPDEAMDAETRSMVDAFFARRALTLRFSGAAVTDTNMELSEDGTSAQVVIPFLDLLDESKDLPEAYYAVLEAP